MDAGTLWSAFASSRDPQVREQLIERYLPLARNAASRLFRYRPDDSVPFADYLQYARIGLVEAIDGYDPGREASFETYSSYRIRGAVLNGLGHETELAAQRSFWRTRTQERMDSLKPRNFGTGDAEIEALAHLTMGLAIGFLLDQDEDEMADETVLANPYAATELTQLRKLIHTIVGKLPERESLLIRRHYFEQTEFQVIARELSVSPGRISQLHAQALIHIRRLLSAPDLDRRV
jgi:RNA polymerase sigma factor for flagellar operon FliA